MLTRKTSPHYSIHIRSIRSQDRSCPIMRQTAHMAGSHGRQMRGPIVQQHMHYPFSAVRAVQLHMQGPLCRGGDHPQPRHPDAMRHQSRMNGGRNDHVRHCSKQTHVMPPRLLQRRTSKWPTHANSTAACSASRPDRHFPRAQWKPVADP